MSADLREHIQQKTTSTTERRIVRAAVITLTSKDPDEDELDKTFHPHLENTDPTPPIVVAYYLRYN
tara:strand:+ start:197 stop:394 length:198 start_codon:yes stop_codon:yes gene_type:complete